MRREPFRGLLLLWALAQLARGEQCTSQAMMQARSNSIFITFYWRSMASEAENGRKPSENRRFPPFFQGATSTFLCLAEGEIESWAGGELRAPEEQGRVPRYEKELKAILSLSE